jgi:hypothetical protein
MRRVIFLVLLGCILLALIVRGHFQIKESLGDKLPSAASFVPEWAKQDYMKTQSCPAIVSQCILPDMISDLTSKIKHQQDLIAEYTKEIVDIENRYPITFRINHVDISNGYLDKIRTTTPLDFSSWVSGSLPYPQLSFTFPDAPVGPPGNKGGKGPVGLSINDSKTVLPAGDTGPPGYIGVSI